MRPLSLEERRKKPRVGERGVYVTVGNLRLVYKDPELMSTEEVAKELVSYSMRPQTISKLTGYSFDYVRRIYDRYNEPYQKYRGRVRESSISFLSNDTLRQHAARVACYYAGSVLKLPVRIHASDMSVILLLHVFRRYRLNEINPIFSVNEVYIILHDIAQQRVEIRACKNHQEPMPYLYFPTRGRCRCPYCSQDSVMHSHDTMLFEVDEHNKMVCRIVENKRYIKDDDMVVAPPRVVVPTPRPVTTPADVIPLSKAKKPARFGKSDKSKNNVSAKMNLLHKKSGAKNSVKRTAKRVGAGRHG